MLVQLFRGGIFIFFVIPGTRCQCGYRAIFETSPRVNDECGEEPKRRLMSLVQSSKDNISELGVNLAFEECFLSLTNKIACCIQWNTDF